MPHTYYKYYIKKNIGIKNVVTIEYLTIDNDFVSEKEQHDFYELAYVDRGSIFCFSNGNKELLQQGDLFFFLPHTEHYYKSTGEIDTNIFIVCANCTGKILEIIKGKNSLNDKSKSIVANIFSEAKKAFVFPFDKKLVPLETPYFGAQQLTETYMEILLTKLVRNKLSISPEIKIVMNSEKFNDEVVNDILSILKEKVYGKIDLDELCKRVHYSKTYINKIFKTNLGVSVMQYYYGLKIDEAKKMLDKGFSVTAISDKLEYDNPNYFTKAFKLVTGLTPSQYKKTINKE